MIHVQALPGTPKANENWHATIQQAENEALMLKRLGFHGLMIENMHDRPYVNTNTHAETTACMSVVAAHLKAHTQLPLGIQILTAGNKAAMACALAAKADFIRAEGFIYSHTAIAGTIEACAADLLRYRKTIGAEHIPIFTDIKKKHAAHEITADISLIDTAKEAEFFLSDGLIITGSRTGEPVDVEQLHAVKEAVDLPVMVGSGITADNLKQCYSIADAFIIGSALKKDGLWSNAMEEDAVVQIIQSYKKLAGL